jgi:hypothetical protein
VICDEEYSGGVCEGKMSSGKESDELLSGSERLLTGILKSPVKRNAWGVVSADDREVWNWWRKTEEGWWLEKSGGRYTLKTIILDDGRARVRRKFERTEAYFIGGGGKMDACEMALWWERRCLRQG